MENPELFIRDFLSQMASQDRRGTADIFYYTIRDEKTRVAPAGTTDIALFVDQDGVTYDSFAEFVSERLKEDPDTSIDDLELEFEKFEEVSYEHHYVTKGVFLTKSDAENHLKANAHHYSDIAHLYVEHAWRAPELLKFFKALFAHFKVDKEWG